SGQEKLLWISRRCMPTECPAQSVTPHRTRNTANALQLNSSGPAIRATSVIDPIQIDFTGLQRTRPSLGSVDASAAMRSEPCDQSIGASCGRPGRLASPPPEHAALALQRPRDRTDFLHKAVEGVDEVVAHQRVVNELAAPFAADQSGILQNREMFGDCRTAH